MELEDLRYVRTSVVGPALLRAASGAALTNDQLDQINQAMADLLAEKGWSFENRAFLLKVRELSGREPSKRALSKGYLSKLQTFLDAEVERRAPVAKRTGKPKAKQKKPRLRDLLTNGERPRFKKEDSPVAKAPHPTEVDEKDLKARVGEVEVLLVTATPTEWAAALAIMQPPSSLITGTLEGKRYVVGRVGQHLVALMKSRAGSGTRDGSLLAVSDAIKTWKPRAVIAAGIAFGGYTAKQKMADVLVSTRLFPYEIRREQKPAGIERGSIPDAGKILLEQFGDVGGWSFLRPDGKECEVREGPLLTGEKLVDDLNFKEKLFKRFPEAIGGEMEGSGIYAACSGAHHSEWIVVKAVCDWGDGTKGKQYQKVAAAAACSLVAHVLSRPNALTAIPWWNAKKKPKEPKTRSTDQIPAPPAPPKPPARVGQVRKPTRRGGETVHQGPSLSAAGSSPSPSIADLKKRLAKQVADSRKVKLTIQRFKWPLIRALVALSVFHDDSPHRAARRVPLADLALELGRTPESMDDYLNDLAKLGYLDLDDDGVRLSGHADSFTQLARAVVKELGPEEEEQAGDLFDQLLA